jgi:hypothetical protein
MTGASRNRVKYLAGIRGDGSMLKTSASEKMPTFEAAAGRVPIRD